MIGVRRARASDAGELFALMRALGYADLARAGFDGALAEVLDDPRAAVFVAERDARLAGLVTLSLRPQLRLAGLLATIDELVVTDAARGQGIGAALLAAARDEARARGAKRLELHTSRARESYARGFYVKNGFREVESAVMRDGLGG